MARKAIREADGKQMLRRWLKEHKTGDYEIDIRCISVGFNPDWSELYNKNLWVGVRKLVIKPDCLFKRRGQGGFVHLDIRWIEIEEIIREMASEPVTVGNTTGNLDHFIIEPFREHKPEDEHYIAITSVRKGHVIWFCEQGGVDIGDVDSKAVKLFVPIGEYPTAEEIMHGLLQWNTAQLKRGILGQFIADLFKFFRDCHCTYLEINPVVVVQDVVYCLDMAVKLDDTAHFTPGAKKWWGNIEFPPPFGKRFASEELRVKELDERTGASLKLDVINSEGDVLPASSGGGASVIFIDEIVKSGAKDRLAFYGEYSGGPDRESTYEYFKEILNLALQNEPHPKGIAILMGGGNANFSDVRVTFGGACQAIEERQEELRKHKAAIFVRRGGPHYEEGIELVREMGERTGIPVLALFGPNEHLTSIVPMAIKYLEGNK